MTIEREWERAGRTSTKVFASAPKRSAHGERGRCRRRRMCPACLASAAIASAALMAAGVISTGGLTALAAKLLRSKNSLERITSEKPKRKEKGSLATGTSKQEGPKVVSPAGTLAAGQ